DWMVSGEGNPAGFWQAGYALNALIAEYPKPYVAFMDGIVMGGGIGLSAHGSLRLVSDRTQVAMADTGIGCLPDVSALHYLARGPGERGAHLALNGVSVPRADAIGACLPDGLITPEEWPDMSPRVTARVTLYASVWSPAPARGL